MSASTCRHTDGEPAQKIVPPRLRIPMMEGPSCLRAESEGKREPASDIDTGVVDSLKVRRGNPWTYDRSACIRRGLAQCKLPCGSVRRAARIGVNSLRTRSAILRLSSSTRPIHRHHRVVIMESAASSRVRDLKDQVSWSLQVRKKGLRENKE